MRGPALRPGVAVIEQVYRGERSFVVKDPVTHKYFRFRPAEAAVIRAFDGSRSLEEIAALLGKAGIPLSIGAIDAFARQISRLGLLEQSLAERTSQQLERLRTERRRRRSLFRGEWLRMRWSLGDSDAFFDRLIPWFRWCFTRRFAAASIAVFLTYTLIVTSRWSDFTAAVTATFSPAALDLERVLVLVVVFLGLTLIHEIAHGLACKRFGGEVHELGVMLLYFTPAFYCNVNDAWSFPRLESRLWVTGAGMWAELVVTGVAAIVWSLVMPGTLIAELALAVILIGGFSAVVANANPLLPLDGYFGLSDALGIPNLRQRASAHLGWLFRQHVLRLELPEPDCTPRERRIFLIYGSLSVVYIGLFLSWLAIAVLGRAYRAIGVLGGLLVAAAIIGLLSKRLTAIWHAAMLALRTRTSSPTGSRWKRPVLRLVIAVLLLLAIAALVPWDLRTTGQFAVAPVAASAITAPDSGVVTELYGVEGTVLAAGAPVVRILDLDLARTLTERNRIVDSLATMGRRARALAAAGVDARLGAEQRAALASAQATRVRVEESIVRARIGGTIVTPRPEALLGRLVGPGDTLLVLHDLTALEARIHLVQAGSARARAGQSVRLIGYQDVTAPFEGTVSSVSAAATGAPVGALEARVPLPHASRLRPGATGEASIRWRRSSLLGAVWWAIRSRIRNDLLL